MLSIKKRLRGFTLVEIMTTILIISVLLAIAMPNFFHAREAAQARNCLKNLRTIDQAVDAWAIDNHAPNGAAANMASLTPYFRTNPLCPNGGEYTVTFVGVSPTCSIGGVVGTWNSHALP